MLSLSSRSSGSARRVCSLLHSSSAAASTVTRTIAAATTTALSASHTHALSSSSSSFVPSSFSFPRRTFTMSRQLCGLEEFFVNQQPGPTGRSWSAADLRLKSFTDLQKLWFVLLKERNMLYTYKHQCKYMGENMQGQERIRKVRQSMKAIKVVLGERYREYKQATDSSWLAIRHALVARRSAYKTRIAKRGSVASHKRPIAGGVARFRLNNLQKYRKIKARREGEQPPTGEFPQAMVEQAARKGHGQEPEALLRKKIKNEKEYF